MKSFKQFDEAIERQAKDRKKLSQPHSVSGSRRDHSHDVDSALTDHVPRKGKGRIRKASKKEMRVSAMRDAGIRQEEVIHEVAPPGWGHTKAEKEKTDPSKPKSKIGGSAAAFKRALDDGRFKGLPGDKTKKEKTASMFKLMWSMKKKGDKPHYKPGTKEKYKKYQEESLSGRDAKKLAKASVLSQSDDPKKQDRARARQVEIDYKDLMDQRKKKKAIDAIPDKSSEVYNRNLKHKSPTDPRESVELHDANGNLCAEVIDIIKPEPMKVPRSSVRWEELIEVRKLPNYNKTGNIIDVYLAWRGRNYMIQMFFPQVTKPSRKDVMDQLYKVYPGSTIHSYQVGTYNPGEPILQIN